MTAGDVAAALEGGLSDRAAEDRRRQSRTRGAWSALILIILATLAAGYGVYVR